LTVSAHVLFSRHDRVGLVTLNRPEKLNAVADQMRDELADVTREATLDDRIGAVVITGAGRAFCAGADIGRMHELVIAEDWDALDALVEAGAAVVRIIDDAAKPVLAAVNGAAAGGGANLALACDIRVAAASASIGETFTRLGLQPDWGGTYFLPRLIGLGRALEMVLTAEMIPARQALELGIFNRLVDDERLVQETMSLAARIAARPPLATALARQAVRRACGSSLTEALDLERVNQRRLFKSREAREAISAFLAKRAPTADRPE
jgi:2-(1,2-epoxy-1,2-dihydrophenyl)acetyl-CoA isomerase